MAETPVLENGFAEPRCRIPRSTDEEGKGGCGPRALCERAGQGDLREQIRAE